MQTKKFITIVIAVIALAGIVGGAFFGGVAAGRGGGGGAAMQSTGGAQFTGGAQLTAGDDPFPGGMNGNAMIFDMGAMGTVSNISGSMITLTGFDGSTIQVYANGSTTIRKTIEVSLSDIALGQNISVSGQRGQSGSVNATDITIEPSFRLPGFTAQQ